MATHKSAIKKARQDIQRTIRNSSIKSRVRTAIRSFRDALLSNTADKQAKETALAVATQELRKAASKGVLHPRNASRRVSRLVLAFNAKA